MNYEYMSAVVSALTQVSERDGATRYVKATPVTDHEDPYGCGRSRIPHFLDNRLTDGGEVVSLTRRPSFTPRKIPGTHFS
jgi:hypothetical protein